MERERRGGRAYEGDDKLHGCGLGEGWDETVVFLVQCLRIVMPI